MKNLRTQAARPSFSMWLAAAVVAAAFGSFGAGLSAQSTTQLPAEDQMIDLSVSELYRVGGIDADPWETFGESLRLTFGPDGTLYILDRSGFRVVSVTADGSNHSEFGKEGEGPGEFRTPVSLNVTPSGDIVVLDFSARGFTIFDSDGVYKESVRIPIDGGTFAMGDVQMDPRGGGVFTALGGGGGMMMMSQQGPGSGPVAPPEPGIPIQRYSLSGDPIETLYRAWDAQATPMVDITFGGGRGGRGARGSVRLGRSQMAYRPTLRWTVTPDGGVAFIDSTTYRIQLVSPQGELTRIFERDISPIPVTDRLKERERARRLEALESGEGPRISIVTDDGRGARAMPQGQIREMQISQLESLEFWEEISPIRSLTMDTEGRFWIERGGADSAEPGPIDIVSFSGAYLGTIPADGLRTPSAFGPNGLVAYIETDEYDVATIVVKRLSGRGR